MATTAYHEYIDKFTAEYADTPEFMTRVREISGLLNADKPVKKKLVIETFQELFEYEYADSLSAIPAAERYKHLGLPDTDPNREQFDLQDTILIHENRAGKQLQTGELRLKDTTTSSLVAFTAAQNEAEIFSERKG